MSHTIEAVLFDNDGTLVDTHDLILDSFRYSTKTVLGREVSDNEILATGGQPLAVQMAYFTDDPSFQKELLRVYREYNHARHDDAISLFPGVREGLELLASHGLALGIVTSKLHWLAWHGLEVTGIDRYFSCCIGADDCDEHKPSPKPILQGADALGCSPTTCAYVGDSPYDIAAGNSACCSTYAALWGMFTENDLMAQHPDMLCDSFLECAEAILTRQSRI